MKRWTDRIRVSDKSHPLFGKTGFLARKRMSDNGAWVAMDDSLPAELREFPEGDPRQNQCLLYPDQCEKA